MTYKLIYWMKNGLTIDEKFVKTNNATIICDLIKGLKYDPNCVNAEVSYYKTGQEILKMDGLGNISLNKHLKYPQCFNKLGGLF